MLKEYFQLEMEAPPLSTQQEITPDVLDDLINRGHQLIEKDFAFLEKLQETFGEDTDAAVKVEECITKCKDLAALLIRQNLSGIRVESASNQFDRVLTFVIQAQQDVLKALSGIIEDEDPVVQKLLQNLQTSVMRQSFRKMRLEVRRLGLNETPVMEDVAQRMLAGLADYSSFQETANRVIEEHFAAQISKMKLAEDRERLIRYVYSGYLTRHEAGEVLEILKGLSSSKLPSSLGQQVVRLFARKKQYSDTVVIPSNTKGGQ